MNKMVWKFSDICVTVEVLCGVLVLSPSDRDSSHRHTLNIHLLAFASRMLCLRRHVQCRGFTCSPGRRRRHELTELSESLSAKESVWASHEHSPSSPSPNDFWNWSELKLQYSRALESRSELVFMMTTKKNCHLNCLICAICLVFVNWW